MIPVFLFGVVGFLSYEAMRCYVVYRDARFRELWYGGAVGLLVRLVACLVGGIVGVVANLDVLIGIDEVRATRLEPELVGCYLRAWGIGFGGPAGLSKWDATAGVRGRTEGGAFDEQTLDTLDAASEQVEHPEKWRFALRRLLLR